MHIHANVNKHAEKIKLSYTTHGDVNWYNHFGKLIGSVY